MKVLGIQFAPWRVPLQRRCQTFAAACWTALFAFLPISGPFLFVYLLLYYTHLWCLMLLYGVWIYFDRETCEMGGRPQNWVKNWKLWWYFRDYFPLHLACVPEAKFSPRKNYFFCCFPHGVLSTGAFNAFGSNSSEFRDLFPEHTARVATLHFNFFIPFFRDFILSMGGVSASSKSINYVLSKPGGGNILVLVPGGAAEAFNTKPGQYKILVKRRKGFIKLALKNGTPLVPVISFGETDLYNQIEGPALRRVQECIKKYIGIAPLVVVGRGIFQYSFGLIPQRKEITTLVGSPIEVPRIESPTVEEIDTLHETFIRELVKLFETYKHKYLKNPDDTYLETVET